MEKPNNKSIMETIIENQTPCLQCAIESLKDIETPAIVYYGHCPLHSNENGEA